MFCLWNPLRGRSCLWRSAGQRSRPQGSRWLPSCLLKLRWGPPLFEAEETALMISELPPGSFFPCLEESCIFAAEYVYGHRSTGSKKCDTFLHFVPSSPPSSSFVFFVIPSTCGPNGCLEGFWGHCSQLEALFFSLMHHKIPRHLVG